MDSEKRLIDFATARKLVLDVLRGKVTTVTAVLVATAMKGATVDAVEVVHADWKDCENADFVYCTNCKTEWNVFDNRAELFYYCPHCGAKMDGGE